MSLHHIGPFLGTCIPASSPPSFSSCYVCSPIAAPLLLRCEFFTKNRTKALGKTTMPLESRLEAEKCKAHKQKNNKIPRCSSDACNLRTMRRKESKWPAKPLTRSSRKESKDVKATEELISAEPGEKKQMPVEGKRKPVETVCRHKNAVVHPSAPT